MERVRAPGRARGRRRHQQARGLGTYKGTGNRNPFHIISGLDGRPRGTRKELVSISTVAAPDFVADALGLPGKAPVILMVRKLLDDEAGADELITVTYAFDPAARNRSLELLAELWF